MKQMKILHGGGFSEEETKNFKVDLMNNVVDNITKLIEMMPKLNIEFKVFLISTITVNNRKILLQQKTSPRDHVPRLLEYQHNKLSETIQPDMARTIAELWRDEGVKECFRRRNEFQLTDSASYFLDNVARLTSPDFQLLDKVSVDSR